MKISWVILISSLMLISCRNPKPRQPVMRTGKVDMSESIAFNKDLLKHEEQLFKIFMEHDTIHTYINSHSGFWYAYETEKIEDSITPIKGNEVTFLYDVKSVDGTTIYSHEELSEKTYIIDQQEFIQGVQEGIKLMKVNEKVLFLLPSLKAYSYHGDDDRIKSNTPLIITVELLEINNN